MRRSSKDHAGQQLTFEPVTEPGWTLAVAGWHWVPDDVGPLGSWMKTGVCPRCGHPFTARLAPGAKRLLPWARRSSAAVDAKVLIECDCGCDHPGRPAESLMRGCGQSGWIERPRLNGR